MKKKELSRGKFYIITAAVIILFFSIVMLFAYTVEKEEKDFEIKEEQKEAMQLQAVSEELNIPEKNILYIGPYSLELFDDRDTYKYRTNQGDYIVEFRDAEIKTIIKDK